MDAEFWLSRWAENRIGFHADAVNPHLPSHFTDLALTPGQGVFVPLCGKTRDIAWLLEQGVTVCGVELATQAVEALFESLSLTPQRRQIGSLVEYCAGDLRVFAGDFFELTAAQLGEVDAVYDRAALIALPIDMRRRYARRLIALTRTAPQLLITLEYDTAQMTGPPFSVDQTTLESLYADAYDMVRRTENTAEIKGQMQARECVWQLTPSTPS